jgi:hypothetical protein
MKIIRTEVLKTEGIIIPEITNTYDPVSKRNDGTITPLAPILILGRNLDMKASDGFRLCLTPATDYIRIIEVPCVHTHTAARLVISLPELEPGEYFPAMLIEYGKGESGLYILPASWVVREE